jgi:2-polyprenyl-3-methyl-5-hydroxy-6-metoxy-1,4-benzoquinol methylase
MAKGYRDRLYSTYAQSHFAHVRDTSASGLEADRQRWAPIIRRYFPQDRECAILDIGCGYGSLIYALRHEGYTCASRIDISADQVTLAHHLGIPNVAQSSIQDYLGPRHEEYDVIAAFDVFEHLTKDELLAYGELVYQALRPGGRLIFRAPNADGPFAGRLLCGDLTHELAFTRTSVEQLLRSVNFDRVAVFPTNPYPHGIVSCLRALIWQLTRAVLTIVVAAETGQLRGHILTQNLIAVGFKSREPVLQTG